MKICIDLGKVQADIDQPDNSTDCENPVEANIQLGQVLGVNGTPTLMLSNGKLIAGVASADEIAALLA
jgi:thiol:disulfide interchange protein DsbC